jgi:putative transposase
MDFVSDRLVDDRWFRVLTVIDQFTRECLLLYADRALSSEKLAAELERIVRERGVPPSITVDNGSEFASRAMDPWAHGHGIGLDFIRPAKPVQNDISRASMAPCGMNA